MVTTEAQLTSLIASLPHQRNILQRLLQQFRVTTVDQLLSLTPCEISITLGIKTSQVRQLYSEVYSRLHAPTPQDAFQLLVEKKPAVPMCCDQLTEFLGGGLQPGMITELVGEAGVGKTQFCLQSLLKLQLPESLDGLAASAVYISTEGEFQMRRFEQIAQAFAKSVVQDTVATRDHFVLRQHADAMVSGLRSNVFLESIATPDKFEELLDRRLPRLLEARARTPIRLVVVDSITALFRFEFGMDEMHVRSRHLSQAASALKRLSAHYGFAVLVTNQVSDLMDFSEKAVIPALGLLWSNCVNTRILLARPRLQVGDGALQPTPPKVLRRIAIVFSPDIPNHVANFVVDEAGVRLVSS